jgi:hypothetical protein
MSYGFLRTCNVFLCHVQKGATGSAAASVSPILAMSEPVLHFTSIPLLHFTLCFALSFCPFLIKVIAQSCLPRVTRNFAANKAASHVKRGSGLCHRLRRAT